MPASISETMAAQRARLISAYLKSNANDFLVRHSRVMDDYFRQCFAHSSVGPKMGLTKNPYALIALGGYGRQEQCVHSDVDLLFLFAKRVPKKAEELVREIVYPLWDLGMEVGHATRSIKECIVASREDYEILTALLDARFICGLSPLYTTLKEQLRSKILKRGSEQVITWLVENNSERHHRFGDSAHLLKPNLKEGRGGLRDYHTMLWIARIKSDLQNRRDLEYYGYLSNDEYFAMEEALAYIWRVRNHLHHLAGRKCDQLHYEHQKPLARSLGYRRDNGQRPVERFLGELHGQMEFVKQQHQLFFYELEIKKRRRGRRRNLQVPLKFDGLEVREGMLFFATPEDILKAPELMMHLFQESARLQMPLSPESKRLIKDMRHLVDDDFRSIPSVVRSFEKILVSPTPTIDVLNEMLNTGFLTAFMPEFTAVVDRILYDEYHIYPVDKHSLRVVTTLKSFNTVEDNTGCILCGDLFRELSNRKLLLWGALLHDIGKGVPGRGHSVKGAEMVASMPTIQHLKPKERETIVFLVREHLRLIKAATRRDTQDEETALICAREIKDPERLKMLYLLTVADSYATGPKAWNDWTATLLRDFFLKVNNILEHGELASKKALKTVEKKRDFLLNAANDSVEHQRLQLLYNVMSPRYLLNVPEHDMLTHVALYYAKGDQPFVWNIQTHKRSDTRIVTVCAGDRPGLISKIAGVFTLNAIDILTVQIFTWRNNAALDVFTVQPPPDRLFETEKWDRAAGHLRAALSGELDLAAALHEKLSANRGPKTQLSDRPSAIVVDNDSSSFYTIVEVHTYDFPGLLYAITDALFRCRLDIWVAKIATNVDQVVDVFYVRDFDGQKIDAPTAAQVKTEIEAVLSAGI